MVMVIYEHSCAQPPHAALQIRRTVSMCDHYVCSLAKAQSQSQSQSNQFDVNDLFCYSSVALLFQINAHRNFDPGAQTHRRSNHCHRVIIQTNKNNKDRFSLCFPGVKKFHVLRLTTLDDSRIHNFVMDDFRISFEHASTKWQVAEIRGEQKKPERRRE